MPFHLLSEHHVATSGEIEIFLLAAGDWVFTACFTWLMYIALEPFVRRRWPGVLIGWSRLLAGHYRDAIIGRDLFVGRGLGVLFALLHYGRFPLGSFFGDPQLRPSVGAFDILPGLASTTTPYFFQELTLFSRLF
jgi:hypothetical protein